MNRRFTCLMLLFVVAASAAKAQQSPTPDQVRAIYKSKYAERLVPLLTEVLRFPTVAGNTEARDEQQKWLESVGKSLGFTVRNAGLITEVELPGPSDSEVLGLIVHGDVQPVNEAEWSFPPFAGVERNGIVYGRGSADDKNGIVQAMLAMAALRDTGAVRTQTIRLLVGSDEESTNLDIATYLKTHSAPNISLVLDSGFPVVVGEKAWSSFSVTARNPYALNPEAAQHTGFALTELKGGLATSIVPSQAEAVLEWHGSRSQLEQQYESVRAFAAPGGYKLTIKRDGSKITVSAGGHAAHAGVNLEGGRNAIVFLSQVLKGKLLASPAADLLLYAGEAGEDIYGTGLGLASNDPLWGHYAVNVATIQPTKGDANAITLTTNIRALPALWGEPLHKFLDEHLARFNAEHHEQFTSAGFFADPPLVIDPKSKLVKRLLADYARATGKAEPPAISGGGTYAKRLPNAVAFGMWFPGKPYPGHDVDEQIPVSDLHRGVDVLIEALCDLSASCKPE